MSHAPLAVADRLDRDESKELAELVREHGVQGAASRTGLSRTAVGSLLTGTARKGTVLQYRAWRSARSRVA